MAKVLLLAPPYVDLYGGLGKAAGRYFPLGLGYIASYLKKYGGHDVALYEPEAQGLSYDDISRIVRDFRPDVVGVSCSTPNFPRGLKLATMVKAQSADIKVVFGGVHVTAIPEFIMTRHSPPIDAVVVGEGERTMLELVDAYAAGRPLSGVQGIVYNEGGKAVRTATRPFIDDMDSIPPPARELIPQSLFIPNAHNARYQSAPTILTSRGCPFNCSFCAARLTSGTRYRTHSPDYVLEEMAMLKRDYGARQLLITDDTFTINRQRLEAICQGMIKQRLKLAWFCFSQVTAVDRDSLKLMREAGCYSIGFGVESADPEILKRMGKNISPERAVQAIAEANSAGMKTQAFYIFGSPGETRQQMLETVALAKRARSTLAFFNMLVPYPGTREFEYYFKDIPLEQVDWEDFVAVGERCVLGKLTDMSGKEIQQFVSEANKQYYMNPMRLLNILLHIRTPFEMQNYLLGAVGLIKQTLTWRGK